MIFCEPDGQLSCHSTENEQEPGLSGVPESTASVSLHSRFILKAEQEFLHPAMTAE
jgi:hypothetical protein